MNNKAYERSKKYLLENIQSVRVPMQKEDYAYFSDYCTSLGVQMSAHIKSLINADLIAHGKSPIIANRNVPSDKEAIGDLIPASQYAKAHNINRTTMIMRCKNGQYQTAQQIEGKWYIDPNEP